MPTKFKPTSASEMTAAHVLAPSLPDDDDDFQTPIPSMSLGHHGNLRVVPKSSTQTCSQSLRPSNAVRSSKKPKPAPASGKENIATVKSRGSKFSSPSDCGKKKAVLSEGECSSPSNEASLVESESIERNEGNGNDGYPLNPNEAQLLESESTAKTEDNGDGGYPLNSNDARLLESESTARHGDNGDCDTDFEPGTLLKELMNLCAVVGGVDTDFQEGNDAKSEGIASTVYCPLCGTDISDLNEESRQVHTNDCLDTSGASRTIPIDNKKPSSPHQVVGANPVVDWLRNLGLSRYEEVFAEQEIDWETLQWLTEEDLLSIGVTPLGPQKKIVQALDELKKRNMHQNDMPEVTCRISIAEKKKVVVTGNKLITEFFPGSSVTNRNKDRGAVSLPPQC